MSPNTSRTMQWNVTIYNGKPALLTSLNVWPPGSTKETPDYMCAAASYLSTLEEVFVRAKPTPHSVLFLYERRSGIPYLIAAAAANSTINRTAIAQKVPGQRHTPLDTPDQATVSIAKALESTYGSLDQVPRNDEVVVSRTVHILGEEWFINTVYMAVPPYDWILVVAIPRKDFFSKIDVAQKTGIIVAIIVAVIGAVVVSFASFGALRPLQTLAQSMQQLTKFDFSSLEGGLLDNRSMILEIRHVQETFSAMVNAFSVSIKKNRALLTSGGVSQTNLSGHHARSISTRASDAWSQGHSVEGGL
ncbi:hypothetical protein HK104_009323 [Borealophlyctis nickersoniae]|nr:hypothetical protein HK104_009323 [Borealophlyctis nickersoniae]